MKVTTALRRAYASLFKIADRATVNPNRSLNIHATSRHYATQRSIVGGSGASARAIASALRNRY